MTRLLDVNVPDIGDYQNVPVIEVLVKAGDTLQADDSIATLESDKATMDVPAPQAGTVREVLIGVGDRVSAGSLMIRIETSDAGQAGKPAASAPAPQPAGPAAPPSPPEGPRQEPAEASAAAAPSVPFETPALVAGGKVHASPSVRHYARELGVDLATVRPSGRNGRISREDVTAHIKASMQSGMVPGKTVANAPPGSTLELLPWPKVDFTRFGPVTSEPLSRIKKISGANLSRNAIIIPHVTNFDEADVTDLEAFRNRVNAENAKDPQAAKLTMLAFLIKASVAALKAFPTFNSSLDGENLVLKQYFHIGFAADTANGLVVPVIRDADRKGLYEIAAESAALAKKAREGKLGPADMSGACFTVSSLGGIGGTGFTPIINAPEVAILGVTRSQIKPVWNGKEFTPRLIMPLCLSWDHRVIDGALAARFLVHLAKLVNDFRRISLG
ncbi:dihydrolipoyllysine-residue acetyltransferase [Thauera sp.]|uniref:dihydrolipoyllysine-residue acetyltransferase n=1 Tax=Thauera sp. TaxID=1905334 RepID=UPI002C0FFC2B|nr:dihydrolipoyllysine-residue acetyltransferase [Thauera sp.]HRO36726.1 dihydrolipoyllysine-residue acetyltransferase [Thauera sp.]